MKVSKSDPVSLYQHYQKEWKKQKLPGEDKRYDLRWAIRERMLSEPEIPVIYFFFHKMLKYLYIFLF